MTESAKNDAVASGEREAVAWSPCEGAHILIVDDDDAMRELLALRLREVGCIPLVAPSGAAALAMVRNGGNASAIDLILIDLRMPGLSGIEVLRRLVIERDGIPALLMTAFADERVRAEALALGIHILDKPFTFDVLRRSATLLLVSERVQRRRARVPSEEPRRRGASQRPTTSTGAAARRST